jgi:hypothetical protein
MAIFVHLFKCVCKVNSYKSQCWYKGELYYKITFFFLFLVKTTNCSHPEAHLERCILSVHQVGTLFWVKM